MFTASAPWTTLRHGYEVEIFAPFYPFVPLHYFPLDDGNHGISATKGEQTYLEEGTKQIDVHNIKKQSHTLPPPRIWGALQGMGLVNYLLFSIHLRAFTNASIHGVTSSSTTVSKDTMRSATGRWHAQVRHHCQMASVCRTDTSHIVVGTVGIAGICSIVVACNDIVLVLRFGQRELAFTVCHPYSGACRRSAKRTSRCCSAVFPDRGTHFQTCANRCGACVCDARVRG